MSSLSDYYLLHMTKNIREVLEDEYLHSSKYLYKKDDKFIPENTGKLTSYVYMTLIKKENMEIMESVNFYLLRGYVYLVFDAQILKDIPFYINEGWVAKPSSSDELIMNKTEKGLIKIIKEYSDTLRNEVLFRKSISLKKYLIEIHIPMVFLENKKKIIEEINEIVGENYKNVSIKLTNNKFKSMKIMDKYFIFGEPLDDFPGR